MNLKLSPDASVSTISFKGVVTTISFCFSSVVNIVIYQINLDVHIFVLMARFINHHSFKPIFFKVRRSF